MGDIPVNILKRTDRIEVLERKIGGFEDMIRVKQDELLRKYGLPINVMSYKELIGKRIARKGDNNWDDTTIFFTDGTKIEFSYNDDGIALYHSFRKWEMPEDLLDEYIIFLESLVLRWKQEVKMLNLKSALKRLEKAKENVKRLEEENKK